MRVFFLKLGLGSLRCKFSSTLRPEGSNIDNLVMVNSPLIVLFVVLLCFSF